MAALALAIVVQPELSHQTERGNKGEADDLLGMLDNVLGGNRRTLGAASQVKPVEAYRIDEVVDEVRPTEGPVMWPILLPEIRQAKSRTTRRVDAESCLGKSQNHEPP